MLRKISQESRFLLSNDLEMSYFKRVLLLVEKIGYQAHDVCMSVSLSEWSNSNSHWLDLSIYIIGDF